MLNRTIQDLLAARKASAEAQAKVKAENSEAHDLAFQLLSAANYIDALGGDSKKYRAAISKAQGAPHE